MADRKVWYENLPKSELNEFRFVAMDEGAHLITPQMCNRLRKSLEAVPTEKTIYIES